MTGSLYLTPREPEQRPSPALVSRCLVELDMLGPLLFEAPDKRVIAAGPGFARHVIYAGCSPYLRFEAQAPHDREFCHVAQLGPYPRPETVTGENTVNPRCPHCRAGLSDWQERLHSGELRCADCGHVSPPWKLDWRRQAACGCYLVELRNVFPGEASPSDRLMDALEQATGMKWTYAWAGMSPEP